MIERFQGENGKKLLLEALGDQQLFNGNSIVSSLIDKGELLEVNPNQILFSQNTEDTDIYFVLAGTLEVHINKRLIATRTAGQHVGEMALINPTGTRSATIVAKEKTVLFKMTEESFAEVAEKSPILWRRLAAELVKRLRERSKYISEPNDKPKVFIGSSTESFDRAEYLKSLLKNDDYDVYVWKDGIFKASTSTLTGLLETASSYDFAILILHPDDVTESRGSGAASPRDNVIFELGMFMGSLSAKRVFILRPENSDLKIPSDLLGITCLPYELGIIKDDKIILSTAQTIQNEIKTQGAK